MRSGGTDDLEEFNHETNVVVDEAEGWWCLDPF